MASSPLAPNPEELAKLPEAEQRELQQMLAEFTQAIEQNPLNGYLPHPKQVPFHVAGTRRRAFIGGNRSGKTTAGVADDLIQLLPADLVPPHLQPFKRWNPEDSGGVFIRVITPDLGFTMEAVLEKFRELTPKFALKGGSFDKGFDKSKRILTFECGSRVDFMSTEQDVDKFGGVKRHRIHYDEEPGGPSGQAIYAASTARLTDYAGDELWTMTPEIGEMWVFELLEGKPLPDLSVFHVTMDDNPHLSEQGKENFKRTLTEEEYKVKVLGQFITLKELYFHEFSEAQHVVDPVTPEWVRDQDIVVGIDPGLNRPGITWTAFDSDNVGLVFAELVPSQKVIADVCKDIKAMNAYWGIDPIYYVIDPTARNRNAQTGENFESDFLRHGIPTLAGQNDRGPGIMEVKRRLQQKGLFVSRNCPTLIKEFKYYRRDLNAEDEFKAVKEFDDLLDSLRYACMSRAWNPVIEDEVEPQPWLHGTVPDYDFFEQADPTGGHPLGNMI